MKKSKCVVFCFLALLIGLFLGGVTQSLLDNSGKRQKITYPISDDDYLCTQKYKTIGLGDFDRDDIKNNDAYRLADNLIADSYNSLDNYMKYSSVISYDDFITLIPYIAGDGTNTKPADNDISDFYLYNISEFKYTQERAIVSFSFDYYQYNKKDCRETIHRDSDSINNPVRIYLKVSDGEWKVDHIYDPI